MTEFALVATVALVVAGLAPVAVIPMLDRAGLIDLPNERSSHSHHALRGGGISQLLGVAASLVTAMVLLPGPTSERLWPVLAALLATGGLGFVEDFRGLPITTRAGLQAATGGLVVLASALIGGQSLWWIPLGTIAVVGLVNVVNFMDGVNAMSAAHGVVAGAAFVIVGTVHGVDWLIVAGLALGSAFLGFVPWNFNGRLFLGDVGSYLLGGTSAIIIVLGLMDGLPLLALAAPFVIYVADTTVTLLGRVLARERWYEAHRDHTYQRLNRRGFSHLSVTAIVTAASLMTTALGIIAAESASPLSAICVSGIVIVAAVYTTARFTVVGTDERNPA